MKSKLSQRQLALKILRSDPKRWFPTWYFVGEKLIDGKWYLLSYKVPTRLTELWQDGLVERRRVMGKSGSWYYEYRIINKKLSDFPDYGYWR